MLKTLINICGSERSGSTMLDLILGNDPGAFSCGEVYALYHPWRKHHFRPVCGCGEECEYLQAFKGVRQEQFHNLLFEHFDYSWVVDSSKDLCWVVDNQNWVIRNGGRVLNLVIWKHPTTFCLSFLKRGEGPEHWRGVFLEYYRRFLETDLPFVSLCYDDFVNAPEDHLAKLCDLTGMNNFPGKMHFWEKTHHQLFGSGGTARQVQDGASEIFRRDENLDRFADEIKSVEKKLKGDIIVNEVIAALRKRELSLNEPGPEENFNTDRSGNKKLWYYSHKALLTFKRYFPETIG